MWRSVGLLLLGPAPRSGVQLGLGLSESPGPGAGLSTRRPFGQCCARVETRGYRGVIWEFPTIGDPNMDPKIVGLLL